MCSAAACSAVPPISGSPSCLCDTHDSVTPTCIPCFPPSCPGELNSAGCRERRRSPCCERSKHCVVTCGRRVFMLVGRPVWRPADGDHSRNRLPYTTTYEDCCSDPSSLQHSPGESGYGCRRKQRRLPCLERGKHCVVTCGRRMFIPVGRSSFSLL